MWTETNIDIHTSAKLLNIRTGETFEMQKTLRPLRTLRTLRPLRPLRTLRPIVHRIFDILIDNKYLNC